MSNTNDSSSPCALVLLTPLENREMFCELGNEEKYLKSDSSRKKNTPPRNCAAKLPSLQKTIKQTHFFPHPVSQNTNVLLNAYNSGRAHTCIMGRDFN